MNSSPKLSKPESQHGSQLTPPRNSINKLFHRIWASPTITTWGSFSVATLNLILVLPLLLTRLSVGEIALWYLFKTVIDLQPLADMGLGVTFSRIIAYVMGGTSDLANIQGVKARSEQHEPNWEFMERVCSTMNQIYYRLTGISILLLAFLGTLALRKPISMVQDQSIAWISWVIVIATLTISLNGNRYTAYLQGTNHIAVYRRWEIFINSATIVTQFAVLLLNGGILHLVLASQAWKIVNVLVNRYLCRIIEGGRYRQFKMGVLHKDIFRAVWPSTWRSSLGQFLGYGFTQLTGLIYAQVGTSANIASYLLGLRLIQQVNSFSRAPFYSKLPVLSRYYSEGRVDEEVAVARTGMILSYWTFVAGFLAIGLFAYPILDRIKSNAEFVPPLLWAFMGLGFFFERFGAMHIQLYSTTNDIIWHIANGVSGAILLISSLLLFPLLNVYAFPIGILISNLGFYSWYSAQKSYRAFKINFWQFERKVMFVPFAVILLYFIGVILVEYF